MVFRLGLPVIIALVGTVWFAWSSYRRAAIAEQTVSELNSETKALAREVRSLDKAIIDGLEAKQRGYLLKSAIESGKIQFMVIPQNGNVSIPVPTQTQTPR